MMKIKYSIGKTINMGNYENVKIDFGVEMTCEEKDKEEKWAEAEEFVQHKVKEEEFKWQV